MAGSTSNIARLLRQGDLWLVVGLFGTILLLILPVPPFLLDALLAMSIALSLLVVLVILYIREPSDFTGFPTLLLFICPLILYWVSRVWLLATRDQIDDDPVVFALKDKTSYAVGALVGLVIWLASVL